jgi:hypothetical protein
MAMGAEAVSWRVEHTDQFAAWWGQLSGEGQEAVAAAVAVLQEHGPGLGQPLVEKIRSSRYLNMQDLRPPAAPLRISFAVDPQRAAILLVCGDRARRPESRLRDMVRLVDRLYDDYLDELRREDCTP